MHIEKIVLRNFKSFGRKTEIPLFKGFTVITGPNGSGKSNIIDSILFCLGLSSSTKQLRADRLTDLVHNGKKEAEVTVVFSDNGSKIEVTRKVKVTEKGYYSYYYLNGRPTSLSEVHEFLSNYGIYSDAYNVVMQGDVTRIIEMSPVQRRKIIDDIAGISEFDEKKERALEELEKVREDVEKIEAVLTEVESRLEVLRKDREEALRYRSLVEKKRELEELLRIHEYLKVRAERDKISREIERLETEKDGITSEIPKLVKEVSKLSEKLEEISKSISELGDERISEINSRILELTGQLESIKKARKIYEEEIKRLKEEELRVLTEISKMREEIGRLKSEIDENIVRRVQVSGLLKDVERKIESLQAELERVDRESRELKNVLIEKKNELEEARNEKVNLLRERDRLIESLRRIDLELEEIGGEIEKLEDENEIISDRIKELEYYREEFERELKEHRQNLASADKQLFSIRSKLADVEEEIRKCEIELAKVRARLSALQTFSKPVEAILEAKRRRELAGIFGTVAQLGEVSEEYVNAIEAAAGNALQFIVVETEDDAVEAIKYLKAIRAGRATFIPLSRIKKFDVKLDKSILKEPGVIDYAVNLVSCDKMFRPVFKFILRDTLVVDTIYTARRLMDRGFRMVTLDGDIIEKSGLMTGGSAEKKSFLISRELLERERELSNEVVELQKEKDLLLRELNKYEVLRGESKEKVEKVEERLSGVERDLEIAKNRLGEIESRIRELKEKAELRMEEKREKVEELRRIEEKIAEVDGIIGTLNAEIEEIEKKLGKSKLVKLLEEFEKLRSERAKHLEVLMEIDKKIGSLEFKKEEIERGVKERESRVEEIRSRVEELRDKVKDDERLAEEISAEIEMLREEEKKLLSSIAGLREERDKLLSDLRKVEERKRRLEFELERLEEKIGALKERLERVEAELSQFGDVRVPEDLPSVEKVRDEYSKVIEELGRFGEVNMKAIQEYEEVRERRDDLLEKKRTLEKERAEILKRIEEYETRKKEVFFEVFNAIRANFREIVRELTNGEGELYLDSDDPFSSGLHIKVKPNNKPVQKLESMSGGEKSLVALALIFAIQMYKPAPFYAFDEVDMFLDGVNVSRVAKMIKKRSKDAQFIVVSLRKPMLENADAIVGVTMGRDNSSLVTGIRILA